MRLDIALLYYLLRVLGLLPLRLLHGLGAELGNVLASGNGRMARHTRTNLKLVRPQWSDARRKDVRREVLRHAGRSLTEMACIWGRSPTRALRLVREVRGMELFERALAMPTGLIIAAPHIGCWELLNYWLCAHTELTLVYAPPRRPAFEALLRRARGVLGPQQIRAEGRGVRQLYRCLAGGGTVGILPDQEPRRGEGRFAPFYGIDALSMVLLPRLAARTGATVLYAFAERLPHGAGFCIHLQAAPEAIQDDDITSACTAMNAGVEACVELAFTQYQWHYKRFRNRPDGLANPYQRQTTACASSVTHDGP